MRPLTDEETKLVLEKLVKYIGKKATYMVANEEKNFVFRLHRQRVYYCDEDLLKFVGTFEKKKINFIWNMFRKIYQNWKI